MDKAEPTAIETAVEAMFRAAWDFGEACGVDGIGFDEAGDSHIQMMFSRAEEAKDKVFALFNEVQGIVEPTPVEAYVTELLVWLDENLPKHRAVHDLNAKTIFVYERKKSRVPVCLLDLKLRASQPSTFEFATVEEHKVPVLNAMDDYVQQNLEALLLRGKHVKGPSVHWLAPGLFITHAEYREFDFPDARCKVMVFYACGILDGKAVVIAVPPIRRHNAMSVMEALLDNMHYQLRQPFLANSGICHPCTIERIEQ